MGARKNQRKAFSYIRFSTPEQMKGDSLRRQYELSKAYAEKNNLELDSSLDLNDFGVSAFGGVNRETGALSKFLKAVDSGQVPKGSVLLVENLDRLSRETVLTALTAFLRLIEDGIEIVTIGDGERKYSKESLSQNVHDLIISITIMSRAHEESATKSKRLRHAWITKRSNQTEKLTRICPAWLKLSQDRTKFIERKEACDLIQRIYEMSAEGMGQYQIGKVLNREKVPTIGRSAGWHSSYISKILSNRAVLGEYQPHTLPRGQKRTPIGDPIVDYFPRVISPALWHRVQEGRKGRQNKGGRKGERVSNLFSHVAKCAYCGGSMVYVEKSDKDRYLVCSNAKRGMGCAYLSWPYVHFENAFLEYVKELDFEKLTPPQGRSVLSSMTKKRDSIRAKLSENCEQRERVANAILLGAKNPMKTLTEKLIELEVEESKLEDQLIKLDQTIDAEIEGQQIVKSDRKKLVRLIQEKSDPVARRKIANEIKARINYVVLFPSGGVTRPQMMTTFGLTDEEYDFALSKAKRDEERWYFAIEFKNGAARYVAPSAGAKGRSKKLGKSEKFSDEDIESFFKPDLTEFEKSEIERDSEGFVKGVRNSIRKAMKRELRDSI